MNKIQITPEARNLIETFRNANVNVYSALSEFVDNSFDAGATRIDIKVLFKNNKYSIFFIDNGSGMSKKVLANALSLGSITEKKATNTGKFGSGMKIAAMNLFDEITIFTRPANENGYFKARINFQEIIDTNSFVGYISELPLDSSYNTVGTAIQLTEDRGKITIFNKAFMNTLAINLGMTFRKFLKDNRSIYINDHLVKAIDPLYPDLAGMFESNDYKLSITNIDGAILCEGNITVRISALKSIPEIKTGGFFIIRNGREILSGGMPKTQDKQKLFNIDNNLLNRIRVELIIDNTFDKYLLVDFNKQNVILEYDALISLRKLLKPTVDKALEYINKTEEPVKLKSPIKTKLGWLKHLINYPNKTIETFDDNNIFGVVKVDAKNNVYVVINGNHHLNK